LFVENKIPSLIDETSEVEPGKKEVKRKPPARKSQKSQKSLVSQISQKTMRKPPKRRDNSSQSTIMNNRKKMSSSSIHDIRKALLKEEGVEFADDKSKSRLNEGGSTKQPIRQATSAV